MQEVVLLSHVPLLCSTDVTHLAWSFESGNFFSSCRQLWSVLGRERGEEERTMMS
jgi:hypothetical protein